MITDNQKELLIQQYYDRGVLKKEIRSYEVSLWTLQDEFITVLKWSDVEQKGRIESPKMTLNIDGTEKFTFSIPMYYRENGKLVENPNWYNVQNDKNLMVGMRKLKVIFNKDNPEIDNVDWRNLYDKIYVPTDYNGNVNLFNRPIVPASKFIEAGWNEFDGTYGTLYSSSDSYTIDGKEYDVIYTPVSMNGSVTTPAALATYISSVISSGSTVQDKLDYDASHSKLLLGIYEVNSDNHNQWAEELHEMQAEWDIIRAKNEWFGYNSNPYNIEFGESSYYYYYQKYLRSINTFEFIITNVTETHEKDILTCEIESEGLAFQELGKIGYKISLSLANFELVYKEWETDGEWTRYDGTKITTQPIQNVQYWCEEAGLEPVPSDPALINSRIWYYDIQMNWDAFADGKRRDPHVVYEESYTSSWDSNLRPLAFENFREKARSIEIENSNLYNITKTIAEKFEIFCKYEYMYDENYHIIGRKVIFYNNFMQDGLGSITLQYPYSSSKISRTMDSTAITTKLFVLDVDEHGIADAEPNASREDYILNFDFLYQTGAITQEQYDAIQPYYKDVRAKNDELISLQNQLIIYQEQQPEIAAKKTVLENSIDIDKEQIEANQRLGNALGALDGVADQYIELSAANPDYLLIHTGENGSRYVNLSTTNKGIVDDSITVWATFGYDKDNKPQLSNQITGFTLDHDGSNNLTTLTFTQDTSAYTSIYLLYKYDPKLYYDNVIKIWETKSAQDELDLLEQTNLLSEINNKIESTTLQIERVLHEKEQIIKAFERLMGPALREGYWQPEDYSDYGDRKISNISLSTSVDLTRSTGKDMKAGWDSEPFTGEQKLYYEEGANRDKVYYPCVNLKSLFGANIPTDLSDYSIVWKATNWEGQSYDWNSIKDLRVLSIGSSALIRFIKFGSEGVIPVLVVTGAQAFTEEELERLTQTGEARLEKYSISVDKISGVASVSHGDTQISINNNWVIIDKNTSETTYPIVQPRIKNSAMTLKTDTDSLFIKYGNNTLSQFSDYYINTRIGKGSGGPEYYITIKPEILIKYGLGQNFNINYILSNANTAIYLDARKVSQENAYPKVSYSIDVNLLNTSLLHTLYSKLARIVMVNDTDLKFENTFGYISQVDLDLDNCQNDTVEIKNYKTKFEDLFSTIVAQTEDIKRSGAGLTTALSGGIPLSEDGFVQTMAQHKDILDAYLDSHFDSSQVVRDRLTDLFGEASDILGGANKTLNKLKSLTLGNAGILSRFAENVAIELTTKVYRSTEKPASFKPGDIWIYTDEHGNEYRYLAMTDSSLSGSGSDFGFVRTHDGSLASIRGANVAWDAEAGIVDITGENEINIRSGNNLYLAANADVNIVGNNSVNIGGSTINIGAGIGAAHFTVSGQINTTKFTNKTNNELGSFWFRYKDGHWTYKNNSVDLADYGITIVVKENQSLVDDVDQLFVWNNGNNKITWMESNNNTMGSINLVASGITQFEEGKANTELAKVLISPYRIEMGAAELEMKAKSKIILRSSTGTYAKTAAISISAEEGVYIGAGQGVRIYSGSPSMQVYVGPAHYSKYQKGDIWVKIKKIGDWAGHVGYDGDAGGTNFYTTLILSGQKHNTFEVEGIYDALDNWNAQPNTPEPATDYGYTTVGWQQRSTANAEQSARSVIAGTGASVELNKEHLLLGFANIGKDQGSAIELTDEFVIIASGNNISGNLTTDNNINVTGLPSGLIGAKFTNSSIGFATQSGSIVNAFIMNNNGLTMGTQNTGSAIDLVNSSKDQLRSHFSSTNNGSYVRIAPEGIELGSLGDLYINTDNFKLQTHSRLPEDYPNGEYIDGNTILALGSGFNSGDNPITGRESISALRTKIENGELDIKLIVNQDGAYFKGNIYADNGVFNGTVNASAGSFIGAVTAQSLNAIGGLDESGFGPVFSVDGGYLGIFKFSSGKNTLATADKLFWFDSATGNLSITGTLFADKIVVREKEDNQEVGKNWKDYLGSRDLSYMTGIRSNIEGIMNEAAKILSAAARSLSDVNELNYNNHKVLKSFYENIAANMTPNTSKGPYHEWYFKTGDIWQQTAVRTDNNNDTISNLDSDGKALTDETDPVNQYKDDTVTKTYIAMEDWDKVYANKTDAQKGKDSTNGWNRIQDGRIASLEGAKLDVDAKSGIISLKAGSKIELLAKSLIDISSQELELTASYARDANNDFILDSNGNKIGGKINISGEASVNIASGGSINLVTSNTSTAYTGTNAIVMNGNGITVAAAAAINIKSAAGIKIYTSDTSSTAAIEINRDKGVWIGANKSVTLHSGDDGTEGEVKGSNFSMTPSRILMGITNVTDTITSTTAIDITSDQIMLAAGTTGGAGASFTTYTNDNITDTTTLAGVQIKSNYIGLATGRGDNTSQYRSLISITPTRILIGVGKKNTINVTETTVSTSSNFKGSSPAITGGYIKIDSSGSKPLFEIGSTGIFKLLTPSVYINGAATGIEDMFALANSDGTQYALKFTANGNLSIKGTVHASAGWFGSNDGWIIGGDIQTNNVTPIIDGLSLANTGSRIQSYNNKVILNAGTANTEPYIIMRKDSTDSNGNAILEDVFEYYNGTLAIKGTIYATNFYLGTNKITTTNGKIDANCINVDKNSFSFSGIGSTEWNGTEYEVALLSKTSMLIGANGTNSGGIIIARDSSSVAAEINKERICLQFPNKVEITNTNTKGEWEKVGDEWKFKVDGNYKISSWIEYNSHWYYVDADGNMLHDLTTQIGGQYYYFDSTGIACDSSILLTDTGLDITGNRLRMNGLEAWGRDDIIVMKRSGENQGDIETRMYGKHDWVLIKPYYDAEIVYTYKNYGASVVSEQGTNIAYYDSGTMTLVLEAENSAGSQMAFGSNAGYYLYEISFKATTNDVSKTKDYVNITASLSNGTDTVSLKTEGDDNYIHLDNVPARGSTNKAIGIGTTGQLSGSAAKNLCTEGARLTLSISTGQGGLILTDITVTCTCDATTSRVPCTVYYYP